MYYYEEELIHEISNYKKMSAILNEITKGNEYFFTETLENVRTIFKFRVEMNDAKMNFRNNPQYRAENYLCDSCESKSEKEDNTHILFCPAYAPIRENKDLNCDQDLANYLQKVLEIRTSLRLNRYKNQVK